jgi:hypothetical protein
MEDMKASAKKPILRIRLPEARPTSRSASFTNTWQLAEEIEKAMADRRA